MVILYTSPTSRFSTNRFCPNIYIKLQTREILLAKPSRFPDLEKPIQKIKPTPNKNSAALKNIDRNYRKYVQYQQELSEGKICT